MGRDDGAVDLHIAVKLENYANAVRARDMSVKRSPNRAGADLDPADLELALARAGLLYVYAHPGSAVVLTA